MSDLPKALREALATRLRALDDRDRRGTTQADDGTEKLLLELADGGRIECVLLRDGVRRTICISTQVGCAMGCVFCASGLDGVDRNLTAGEIVEQMLLLDRLLPPGRTAQPHRGDGHGRTAGQPRSAAAGAGSRREPSRAWASAPRRITISTVGLPPAMRRLAEQERATINLAVSLHAPNDELRNQLVPVNKNIGLAAILAAADRLLRDRRAGG